MHITGLCYSKGGWGEGSAKKCVAKRGGSGEFENGLPAFAPAPTPSK